MPGVEPTDRATRAPRHGVIVAAHAAFDTRRWNAPAGEAAVEGVIRFLDPRALRTPTADEALPGRAAPIEVVDRHHVLGSRMTPPFPESSARLVLGMGCFWGAEKAFWALDGVVTTAVGYAGGHTPNPTYEEVCSGGTGHAEVVLVVFDPSRLPVDEVLRVFWEGHDPTQGMRQGADVGTQYRSAVYWAEPRHREVVERSREAYQRALAAASRGEITAETGASGPFYYAEPYHQQYLAKNPGGYCGLGGTGVACPGPGDGRSAG